MAVAFVLLAALALTGVSQAAGRSGASPAACKRLGGKLERQRSGLARARNPANRAAIRRNIRITRRLRRLACHSQPRPRLPSDFRGSGRYLVPVYGFNVPFVWRGGGGNSEMIAGGDAYPIYFINLIYGGSLYTITYRWPGVNDHPCSRIPGFTLDTLNQIFAGAAYVGPEVLNRNRRLYVNHWRLAAAVPVGLPGFVLPIPAAEADIYVDESDPTTFRRVLHFGFQNLYAPDLDEWIVMHSFKHAAGAVTLPPTCQPPSA